MSTVDNNVHWCCRWGERNGGPSNKSNRAMMMPLSLKWYSNPISYRSEAIETGILKGISAWPVHYSFRVKIWEESQGSLTGKQDTVCTYNKYYFAFIWIKTTTWIELRVFYYVKESGHREVNAVWLWNVNNRSCTEKETIATVSRQQFPAPGR